MASQCSNCMSSGICVACSCARQDDSEVRHIVPCVATAPCFQPSSVSISSQPVITLSSSPQSPQVVELPSFHRLSDPHFQLNDLWGVECAELVSRCYSKAVHWIPNLFKIPYWKQISFFLNRVNPSLLSLLWEFSHGVHCSEGCICISIARSTKTPT